MSGYNSKEVKNECMVNSFSVNSEKWLKIKRNQLYNLKKMVQFN